MKAPRFYNPAKYRTGSTVRALPRSALEAFAKSWKYHHPIQPHQLEFAGKTAKVKGSYMYHGGDMLYELEGVAGLWHEQCLEAVAAQQGAPADVARPAGERRG